MKSKIDLIKQCRYYSGEDKSPFEKQNHNMFWFCESVYVLSDGNPSGEEGYFQQYFDKRKYKGIPEGVALVIFTIWGKQQYNIHSAIDGFYQLLDEYLDSSNE